MHPFEHGGTIPFMACLAQVDTCVAENAGQPCSTIENLYIYN
jgi:hypothetical protein